MSNEKTASVKPRARNQINWPTSGYFTIEDLQKKHPSIVNITLRFHIKKAEEAGVITFIGKFKPAIGRPKKVYASSTPAEGMDALLENAKSKGVILINSETQESTPASETPAPVTQEPVHA